MAADKDIMLTNDNVLRIEQGDFVVAESDGQSGRLLLQLEKGQLKYEPLVGIGIRRMLNTKVSPNTALKLQREIRAQFLADGVTVSTLNISSTSLKIDYERI
jgi:hypothetical protein